MGSIFSCTMQFSSHFSEKEIAAAFAAEGFKPENSEIFNCKKTSETSVIVSFVREVSYSSAGEEGVFPYNLLQ